MDYISGFHNYVCQDYQKKGRGCFFDLKLPNIVWEFYSKTFVFVDYGGGGDYNPESYDTGLTDFVLVTLFSFKTNVKVYS